MSLTHPMGEAPELLALKLRISLATQVDPYELADWTRANQVWLSETLDVASDRRHPDHIAEEYASLRVCFKNFRPVAAPAISTIHTEEGARPAGSRLQRVWRKWL